MEISFRNWRKITTSPLTGASAVENVNKIIMKKKTEEINKEMLKELKETVIDLKILQNNVRNEKGYQWEGMVEVIQKWIDRKEDIIKLAK